MSRSRLEAFSDGVLAIIITIMVLNLRIPNQGSFRALAPLYPVFGSYVLSFIYVAIYWGNHHNMIHAVKRVSGKMIWTNMHLLFWISLFPFCTGWMGENHFASAPTALYGVVLLMASIAYMMLQRTIISADAEFLKRALGRDWKGKLSPLFYVAGIVVSPWSSEAAQTVYGLVAILWLIPDRRIARAVERERRRERALEKMNEKPT
ncbi:TMEM175 family protein [Alicyclobacillus sp. ALC3]|uniref:TMEM175 family protein n=1 Tax=Alicyclobacillus sp. ALC3 TaxID=2796143 RepID=UPI00237951FD|nr:TMEM175 family protein [Alicyclobacillus sp. ALC3]WDL95703.1 DUF1211 domain-containing protein [Alicyclobacillus sp. ALC3]